MVQMQGGSGFGARRRFLAEQAEFMEEKFGKAEGFTTPITKPAPSFKAPSLSVGGATKPKVAALKPTGNTLPTASSRLASLKEGLQSKVGQTTPGAGAPSAVGTVGKRESRKADYGAAAVGGAGVLAATQAEPGRRLINAAHRAKIAEPRLKTHETHLQRFRNLNAAPPPEGGWRANEAGLSRGAARREARSARTAGQKKIVGRIQSEKALINRGLISGKQRLAFQAAAGGGGALLAYGGLRRAAVNKRVTQRDVDSLAMGAAGGVAVHQGSYIPTKIADNRAERRIKKDPAAKTAVAEHKAKHGISGVKPGDPRWKGYFRSYPTQVPGGKLKRALAYTHSGKTGMAVGALTIGGGAVGTARLRRGGKFQSQAPSRVAKREPLKTSVSEDDARKLVDRHGLKGPLPKQLNREQKMAAYEARYVSAGGRKAEKWDRRARVADRVKTGGLGVATAGGAGWLATRGKLKARVPAKTQHHAETVAGAGAVAGGAGELYAAHARRKRSSYASAPAGVAASALRRMQDYTP